MSDSNPDLALGARGGVALADAADELSPLPGTEYRPPPTVPSRRAGLPRRFVGRVFRRPVEWVKRPWPDDRVIQVAITIATLAVTTFIMMQVVHFNPLRPSQDLILDTNTPTGGDMGAHVWGPAYLRDHLLPNWQLSGWSMDWYGGLPVYRFYMVIPALMIVALDTFLHYGVAFKLVVISGLVSLPICCWAFGRLAKFRYPLPELFALAGVCFALSETYEIYGGNLKSTMAGEFSFSIALSLMMLGLGLLARSMRTGTHRVWAAVFLTLACLSHGIVLIYTVITAAVIVVSYLAADWIKTGKRSDLEARRRFRVTLATSIIVGGLTILLFAFWVGPFLLNHAYMTDMKYGFRPSGANDSFWDMLFDFTPALDFVVTGLALAGFGLSIVRRHLLGIAVGITAVIAVVMVYITRDSLPVIGLLWNPRVLPFFYIMRWLLMMIGIVEVGGIVVALIRNRPARERPGVGANTITFGITSLVVLFILGFFFQVLPFGNHRMVHGTNVYGWGPFSATADAGGGAGGDGWSAYNFKGYEGRDLYPEYHDVVETMAGIGADPQYGCGRALWENNGRSEDGNGRYGTTMALMLLPFWTDGCIGSMEALYFEASGTTPYSFLASGAMSRQSSNPVRQLRYVNNDAAVGVGYLQSMGVQYVMVHTDEAIAQADAQADLTPITTSGPWHIYAVAGSDIVTPLTVQPVVVNPRPGDQRERNLELGTSWMQHSDEWAAMPANGGPETWQHIDVAVDEARAEDDRVDIVTPVQQIEPVELLPVTVSNVDIGQQSVEFDVDQIGVPVIVKVSYFPNWQASGADGPWRIAPNEMVVIPTEQHVTLNYERSSSDTFFYLLTFIGLVLAVLLRVFGARINNWVRATVKPPPLPTAGLVPAVAALGAGRAGGDSSAFHGPGDPFAARPETFPVDPGDPVAPHPHPHPHLPAAAADRAPEGPDGPDATPVQPSRPDPGWPTGG